MELVKNIDSKNLNFSILLCGDRIISMHFGFIYDKWIYRKQNDKNGLELNKLDF